MHCVFPSFGLKRPDLKSPTPVGRDGDRAIRALVARRVLVVVVVMMMMMTMIIMMMRDDDTAFSKHGYAHDGEADVYISSCILCLSLSSAPAFLIVYGRGRLAGGRCCRRSAFSIRPPASAGGEGAVMGRQTLSALALSRWDI